MIDFTHFITTSRNNILKQEADIQATKNDLIHAATVYTRAANTCDTSLIQKVMIHTDWYIKKLRIQEQSILDSQVMLNDALFLSLKHSS